MNPAACYWGVLGGLLFEAGRFAASLPFVLAAPESSWADLALAGLLLVWWLLCCVLIGRWSAPYPTRHRVLVVLVNASGFAAVVWAPRSGSWYSVDWLTGVLTSAALAAPFIAAGYVTRRPNSRLQRPAAASGVLNGHRSVLGLAVVLVNSSSVLLLLQQTLFFASLRNDTEVSGALTFMAWSLPLAAVTVSAGLGLLRGQAWSWPWVVCWACATVSLTLASLPSGWLARTLTDLSDWTHGYSSDAYEGRSAVTACASLLVAAMVLYVAGSQARPPGVAPASRRTWIVCAATTSFLVLARVLS